MKRNFSGIIASLLLICMLLGAVGCNTADTPDIPTDAPTEAPTAAPTDAPTEAPTDAPTAAPTDAPTDAPTEPIDPSELEETFYYFPEFLDYFKTYGRVQESDRGLVCDPSASGIEFNGVMTGEVILELEVDRNTHYTVFIDGERVDERFLVEPDQKSIVIADFGETAEEHTVRVLKQTEPKRSLATIFGVTLTGYLNDAPEDDLFYIEFIGDSITSGTGIFGSSSTSGSANQVYIYQDATSNYAFRTAEALEADFSLVSCSSIGLATGWNDYIESEYYPAASYFRDENAKYDFERTPDLVVINLGTNDYTKGCSEKQFKGRVEELIDMVRDNYSPSVDIVWVYNMMNDGKHEWILETLEDMGGEDNRLYSIKVERNNEGGTEHPDLDAHIKTADALIEFIKEHDLLYW